MIDQDVLTPEEDDNLDALASASLDRVSLPVVRRLLAADPAAWTIGALWWTAFFALPLPIGLAARELFERADGTASSVWLWLAVFAGLEVGRWSVLVIGIVQWHGCWVFWHTLPRVNMMRSLVSDPGPSTGRLPGSPGEAVSRFRDDARDVAMVLDVWLDVTASFVSSVAAFIVLLTIDTTAAVAVVLPVVAVLWIGQALGHRLRRWRWAERRRTARVTSFLGETFGAITAVKVAGAEQAVRRRFVELGEERAWAARRDQVGTQMLQTMSGVTASAGIGLALLAIVGPIRGGDLGVGDVALFTAYATLLGSLPRMLSRNTIWRRQADVSVTRLGRLMRDREPIGVAAPAPTWLRTEPPAMTHPERVEPARRGGVDRFEHLEVRDLAVRLDDDEQIRHVDLDVHRGQLVVVTGAVGAGKSLLLRSLLGLVPRYSGRISWNGEPIVEPSVELVPPRVAYVPQVPRLFSETLTETVLLGEPEVGLVDALWLACVEEDVARFPDGLDTMVGPKGVRLSGGQIQRTAAARAFVRRPEVLVIDDLSSALDVATETLLWDRLFEQRGERTVIAVSHRPRVLAAADLVVSLENGRVVA
ncbi:MAG: ABC transporter ATP-binding protein/permease [Actinomycetota bacterium]|nr:ABC transporter ATP-binding protein/permease [Actinomycetota bacterium]